MPSSSLIEPGDEVILLAPYLGLLRDHREAWRAACRASSQPASRTISRFLPQRVAEALSPNTKLLLLNSPNNPTGAVWTRSELAALAAVVAKHPRLMVLSDEMYEYIIFDGEAASFGALARHAGANNHG